ncbi:hypothetical protein H0H81_004331 [Sphagnurus paluster]|uniref:Uncharacterized protein n=1 Tax=Sphagnurus paluster TaxID=117069 RepID=A0A9P7FUI8_9AGAR|nr:hypothetical protein H0H81_004331 [Sphagnurus paluster]
MADLNDVLTASEREILRPTKAGLLAALCAPRCGQPQLRFLADFLNLLIVANGRMYHARSVQESGWFKEDSECGVNSLGGHELFQYLLPELKRLVSRAGPSWDTRFAGAVHSYHSAQLQVITNRRVNNIVPDLESYLPLRRHLSGLYMLIDLFELCENLDLTPGNEETINKLEIARQLAADIIGCSLDVFAFNIDQAQGNSHNLVTVLMTHKQLSLQGALNFAGVLIKQKADSFIDVERSLLSSPTPMKTNPFGTGSFSSYWDWIKSGPYSATPPDAPSTNIECGGDLTFIGDVSSYLQVLKDCIVGTINWAYETELYFGKKGEEIRSFGWVFLSPKIKEEPSETADKCYYSISR